MRVKRHRAWASKLVEYVESKRSVPFSRKDNDCVRFIGGAVEAQTGVNIARDYASSYVTDEDAERLKSSFEGGFIGEVNRVCKSFGIDPLPNPLFIQRGDIAMIDDEGHQGLGVCVGGVIATPGPKGVVFVSIRKAVIAWRVPYGN